MRADLISHYLKNLSQSSWLYEMQENMWDFYFKDVFNNNPVAFA